jgi:hypothetical protein
MRTSKLKLMFDCHAVQSEMLKQKEKKFFRNNHQSALRLSESYPKAIVHRKVHRALLVGIPPQHRLIPY